MKRICITVEVSEMPPGLLLVIRSVVDEPAGLTVSTR